METAESSLLYTADAQSGHDAVGLRYEPAPARRVRRDGYLRRDVSGAEVLLEAEFHDLQEPFFGQVRWIWSRIGHELPGDVFEDGFGSASTAASTRSGARTGRPRPASTKQSVTEPVTSGSSAPSRRTT